jgi:hypothetical protein
MERNYSWGRCGEKGIVKEVKSEEHGLFLESESKLKPQNLAYSIGRNDLGFNPFPAQPVSN